MISVIISSGNAQLLAAVRQNVADTIGVPYELIAFDNTGAAKGICEIYNEGIAQARYNLLCFMHEDILLQTNNWGQIVNRTFVEHPHLGLLGVAGSPYKPLIPSGWNGSGPDVECINLVQQYKFKNRESHLQYKNPFNTKLAEVAAIDGVWFCATKEAALRHRFDAETFKGFHGYDVDFSLAIGTTHQVAVTYEVLLTHFSEGNYNQAWVYDILTLHRKWASLLPVNKANLPVKQALQIEKITFYQFIIHLNNLQLPLSIALKVLWQEPVLSKLGATLFFKLNFYILKKMTAGKS